MDPKNKLPLSITHPELASEFDIERNAPNLFDQFDLGSHKKVWWLCRKISKTPCGHNWKTPVRRRTGSGGKKPSGCPSCSGRVVHSDGRNSMRKTHSKLTEEFDMERNAPLTPDVLKAGTGKELFWLCKTLSTTPCGYSWKATGDSRLRGRGCPACANKVVHTDGRNSMRNTHPDLAKEFDTERNAPLTPDSIISGTDRMLHWKCTTISNTPCGHRWQATPNHRTGRNPSGCPVCAGNAVHEDGRNSMRNTHPDLAEEFDMERNAPLTPDDVLAGTNKKLHWVCRKISNTPCKHRWINSGEKRSTREQGCPVCAGNAVHEDGRNSMRNTHPDLAEEFDMERNAPLTPDDVLAGTNKKLHWVCRKISKNPCGFEWPAISSNRAYKSVGCPNCAEYGFNRANPAWYYVYAVIKPDGNVHCYKGGKTNENLDQRFDFQRKSLRKVEGYEDFEYLEVEKIRGSGEFIHVLEKKLLDVDKELSDCEKLNDRNRIRFPPIEGMEGKNELFKINPLDYARENGLLDDWEPIDDE